MGLAKLQWQANRLGYSLALTPARGKLIVMPKFKVVRHVWNKLVVNKHIKSNLRLFHVYICNITFSPCIRLYMQNAVLFFSYFARSKVWNVVFKSMLNLLGYFAFRSFHLLLEAAFWSSFIQIAEDWVILTNSKVHFLCLRPRKKQHPQQRQSPKDIIFCGESFLLVDSDLFEGILVYRTYLGRAVHIWLKKWRRSIKPV